MWCPPAPSGLALHRVGVMEALGLKAVPSARQLPGLAEHFVPPRSQLGGRQLLLGGLRGCAQPFQEVSASGHTVPSSCLHAGAELHGEPLPASSQRRLMAHYLCPAPYLKPSVSSSFGEAPAISEDTVHPGQRPSHIPCLGAQHPPNIPAPPNPRVTSLGHGQEKHRP